MKKILSVFFSSDRVYLTVTEPTSKGLALTYINSTEHPFDLLNHESDDSLLATEELFNIINSLDNDISDINFTLPAENVLVSSVPYNKDVTNKELRDLVNLEIRQSYPQFNYDDFRVELVPMEPAINGKQYLLSVIIPKSDFQTGENLFRALDKETNNVDISQLSAHNAFLYNYPEHMDKTIALFGIQEQFVDISVIKKGKPVYYNLASMPFGDKIGDLCRSEINKIILGYAPNVDGAYFFGSGLTKSILDKATEALKPVVNFSGRLNAFRMISTYLGSREREYCSRVSHIFPACIGNSLPSYHERITLD